MPRILVACEFSGRVRDAFRALGYDAWSCDLLPTDVPGPHVQCDIRELDLSRVDLLIAHPPCTYLCNSGVRWLHTKPGRWQQMEAAADFFRWCLSAPVPRIAVENPVMHGHARALVGRSPDFTVQPWMFGDGEIKRTCFWTKGLPPLVPTNIVEGRHARVHRAAPSPERWKLRSLTPLGLAAAMASQWGLFARYGVTPVAEPLLERRRTERREKEPETMPAKTRKQTAPKRWNHLEAAEIDARVELGPLPWLNRQAYSPDERQRVPAAGAWILVVRPLPPMERDIDLHVRPGCIFYAQRDPNADENGFTADGTYKILLDTPWGTVKLFPHEFARVESDFVLGCWQADELAFHPLHIDAARLNDVVFYAQSRGIPLASAVPMALGTLNGNVGWFEPVPEIAKQAESMAKHSYGFGGLTAVNHRRRAEAKARHSLTPEN